MPSVSRAQALLLSHPEVWGSYLATNNTDQLLPRLPKVPVVGDSLRVTRVDTLATASFVTSGGTADDSATTYVSTAREFPLRRIPAKVLLNGDIAQNVSNVNDVFEQQIQAKMVAIWNAIGSKLIYGTGVDPEPAGLATLAAENPVAPFNPAGGAGTALTLTDIEKLIENMAPWEGGSPRALVMNRGQYRKMAALARAAGFTLPIAADPVLGKPVAHYLGVPILVSDWILNNEGAGTNTTSVYMVYLGPRQDEPQLGGLVWFYNQNTNAGIRVDGPHRTSSTTDVLFSDLEINIGFASLSTGAVLRLKEVLP